MPTAMFTPMFDEPSRGSIATASGASGFSRITLLGLLGGDLGDRRAPQGRRDALVSDHVEGLLHVAVAVVVARRREVARRAPRARSPR